MGKIDQYQNKITPKKARQILNPGKFWILAYTAIVYPEYII